MTILNILMWITAIISIASVIAAITPTPKDDVWIGKIYKIIDFGRAIYNLNGVRYCSDSFHPKGDAATQ